MSLLSYLAIFTLALGTASPRAFASDATGTGSTSTYIARPPVTTTLGQQFLQAHNDARAVAGVPPLAWNYTLKLDAQRYANELRIRCSTIPLHAWGTDGVYGRNLFKGEGFQSVAETVASWVDERRWYDNSTNRCAAPEGKTCGDYTQVVWRATTQVGCFRRLCREGVDTVTVCEYYPPGNVKGQRPY